MKSYHSTPAYDIGGEPCWLLRPADGVEALGVAVRRVEVYARWYDVEAEAWRVDHEHVEDAHDHLQRVGLVLCDRCCDGTCAPYLPYPYRPRTPHQTRWSPPEGVDHTPGPSAARVAEAAQALEVAPPYTLERVRAAFKRKALKAHPDRGGTEEQMRRAIGAREILLALLPSAHTTQQQVPAARRKQPRKTSRRSTTA